MRCFTVSRTTCSGVCSRRRTRRRAFWRAPGDATTFHKFYRACTGCQWSNGASSNWPLLPSSRCAAKPHCTPRTTASLSLTPDHAVFARLTPTPSLSRELTRLGDISFSVADPKVWNSLPHTLRQPDVELGQFKRLLDIFVWRGCNAVTFCV